MAAYDLQTRRARYFTLSSQISHLDNSQLRSLFAATEPDGGRGRNHVLDIEGEKVFVKRVPVTDLEYDNMFSTKNLYALPTYYNYGVGSAGFGVFRELVANIKTTNWVLGGAVANFPLLYHYRMLPYIEERPPVDMERHHGYVEYWNSNANIGRYVLDRANARHELALFLEYIPYPLGPWLRDNPNQITRVLEDLRRAVAFLRNNGIVHFDAHFHNVLSDGERTYLTDFGLALDERFSLSEEETAFLKRHTHYDYAEILGSMGFLLYEIYESLSNTEKQTLLEKYGITDGTRSLVVAPVLLNHIEGIAADGMMQVDKEYIAIVVRYRSIIELFLNFIDAIRDKKKDAGFPHAKLVRLLEETDFLTGTI